jgi:uncharacterized peroxidase-related enzyme
MPHITLPEGIPGIRSLAMYSPETAKPLYDLAQVLLREASPLSPAERELIAAYVSSLNNCTFCKSSHAAAARELYKKSPEVVDSILDNKSTDVISDKLKALLKIAAKVQVSGRNVTAEDVDEARRNGAIDRDIHDTVLIAATFCMFNRYVDGLATFTPETQDAYLPIGQRLASSGYIPPQPPNT